MLKDDDRWAAVGFSYDQMMVSGESESAVQNVIKLNYKMKHRTLYFATKLAKVLDDQSSQLTYVIDLLVYILYTPVGHCI